MESTLRGHGVVVLSLNLVASSLRIRDFELNLPGEGGGFNISLQPVRPDSYLLQCAGRLIWNEEYSVIHHRTMRLICVACLLAVACGGDVGTEPAAVESTLESRDIPGVRTAIAATGSRGSGTMDLSAEVIAGPEGGPGFTDPVEGGTFTVEEEVCSPARTNPAHPAGEKCRWQVYTVPEGSFNELAGEDLRNVPNDHPLFLLEIPVTMLRISYRSKGTQGAEDVLDCPWIPVEFIYFCNSDGTVDFLTVEDARKAERMMNELRARGRR